MREYRMDESPGGPRSSMGWVAEMIPVDIEGLSYGTPPIGIPRWDWGHQRNYRQMIGQHLAPIKVNCG
jgi:hypothetical protein